MTDERKPTLDDAMGIAWWNALTEQERARWMQLAENTGVVADAWAAFQQRRSKSEAWLSELRRLAESTRMTGEASATENDLDNHADHIAPLIESLLMAIPVENRESAIEAGRDFLVGAGSLTPKSFARAYGIVLGNHVCDDKYGIDASKRR